MTIAKRFLAILSGLLFAFTAAAPAEALAQSAFSQRELDQLLAPVALYPDPLLSQVLMAATYPRDVVEAADWSRSHARLQGDEAVRAVRDEDWDPSVKSLCAFPQLLARMDEKLDWTRDLGDAFLAQEAQVMDTVQQLRQRASAAGSLRSSEELYVQEQGPVITINLANPGYLYVPYYDPMVVYGSWWWPGYQPVVWAPWPGYARRYSAGVSIGFWWGAPIALSANFFYGSFDWHRRQVQVVQVNNDYYRPPVVVNRTVAVERGHWQHDPQHRRDVGYRDAVVRARFDVPRQEPARTRDERPQMQPQAPSVTERRPERQVAMETQRHAQQQAQEAQRQAQQQQARQAQEARRQAQETQRQAQETQRQAQEAQRHARPEQRPIMPAAQTPQTPQTSRTDRQVKAPEQRQERGQKS